MKPDVEILIGSRAFGSSHPPLVIAEIHKTLYNPKARSEAGNDAHQFPQGSIVADRFLSKETVIEEKDIWARRSGSGEISVAKFNSPIGLRVSRDINRNQQLSWKDFD